MAGHSRYERELVRALAEVDRANEYVVVLRNTCRTRVVEQAHFTEVRLPGSQAGLRNLLFGAGRIGAIKADIFHSLHQFLPRGIRGRTVVTLHDLFRIEHPELIHSGWVKRLGTRFVQARDSIAIPYSLRRADHTISVSHCSAVRAQQRLNIDPSRMTVIPHGVSDSFLTAGGSANGDAPATDPPNFLMVGDSTRHKNVSGAIDALGLLAQRLPDVHLWAVGAGSEYSRLTRQAAALHLAGRVRLVPQVPDDELIRAHARGGRARLPVPTGRLRNPDPRGPGGRMSRHRQQLRRTH